MVRNKKRGNGDGIKSLLTCSSVGIKDGDARIRKQVIWTPKYGYDLPNRRRREDRRICKSM